jgi:hypothetical protein
VIANPGCAVALVRWSEAGCVVSGNFARQVAIGEIRQVHSGIGEKAVVPGEPRVHLDEIVAAVFLPILELQRSQPAIPQRQNQLAALGGQRFILFCLPVTHAAVARRILPQFANCGMRRDLTLSVDQRCVLEDLVVCALNQLLHQRRAFHLGISGKKILGFPGILRHQHLGRLHWKTRRVAMNGLDQRWINKVARGISYLLPRAIGSARAAEIMLTGRDVDAHEALQMGLISRVVPHAELFDACFETADRMIGWSRPGIELTKRSLWSSLDAASLQQHLQLEGIGQLFVRMLTQNFEEATRARREQRKPIFRD